MIIFEEENGDFVWHLISTSSPFLDSGIVHFVFIKGYDNGRLNLLYFVSLLNFPLRVKTPEDLHPIPFTELGVKIGGI